MMGRQHSKELESLCPPCCSFRKTPFSGLQPRFGECWGVAGAGVPTESLRHRERGKKLSRKAVRGRETMLPSLCWGHSGLG